MFFDEVSMNNEPTVKMLEEAYQRLVSNGVPPEVSESIVKRNFEKLNKSNVILTVEGLCRQTL
jgi:hypothetical protein